MIEKARINKSLQADLEALSEELQRTENTLVNDALRYLITSHKVLGKIPDLELLLKIRDLLKSEENNSK